MSAAIIHCAEPANAEAHTEAHAQVRAPASLNTVAISAAHMEAAMKVLTAMAASRGDPPIHADALRHPMRDAGFADEESAGAALHARINALSNWIETHDPHRQSGTRAGLEAAARFPLSALSGGVGFDPAGFQEMVLSIEDLPW